jgi:hypothetical protein
MRHFLLVVLVLIVFTSVGYAVTAAVSVGAQAFYTGEPIIGSVRSLVGPPAAPTARPKPSATSSAAGALAPPTSTPRPTNASLATAVPTPSPVNPTPSGSGGVPSPTATQPSSTPLATAVLSVAERAATLTATTLPVARVGNTGGAGTFLRHSAVLSDHWLLLPDGTTVVLLGSQAVRENENWLWVQDPQGNVGWIQSRYVVQG